MIIHWKTTMIADVFDAIFHYEMTDVESETKSLCICLHGYSRKMKFFCV